MRQLILHWQCTWCWHKNTIWSKWHRFAAKTRPRHWNKEEKCAFVTVWTQGHAARLDDTRWVQVWGRGGGWGRERGLSRQLEVKRPLKGTEWWMSLGRKSGKEINSGLSFDYCQRIHTHLLPFDAKENTHCSFCGIFSDRCSRGVLFQVLPLILCALTPARVQPASVKRASRVWIMWQEAWYLKTEKLVTRSSSAHLDGRGGETLICGCCNKSADLFPLTRCWVPFGLEDSISAQRFETSYTSIYLFIPTEETLDVIMASHQSADSELSIGINETVT